MSNPTDSVHCIVNSFFLNVCICLLFWVTSSRYHCNVSNIEHCSDLLTVYQQTGDRSYCVELRKTHWHFSRRHGGLFGKQSHWSNTATGGLVTQITVTNSVNVQNPKSINHLVCIIDNNNKTVY